MLDQALFGSTAERVIRKSPCPVLTCQLHQRECLSELQKGQ
jgi:hypothetical protein